MALSPLDALSVSDPPSPSETGSVTNMGAMRDPRILAAELTLALGEKIRPVRTSLLYKFWLLLAAVAMVALPLTYIAMIAGVGWLVWLHATRDLSIFSEMGVNRASMAIYVVPLLIGVLVIAFMIKPLLAKPARSVTPRALKPEEEPVLFAFVAALCDAVRAPRPAKILVDMQANASAGLIGGLWGVLLGRLQLTIGLPLVAGLNLRQLTGVLAHEFGHFGQGGAMRCSYIIHVVNYWFARVVYHRDSWDEGLERAGADTRLLGAIAIFCARGCIWLTRQVLRVLMWIAHLLTSFLSRQMEFDADRYEMRVAGSQAFEQTARRLPLISIATRQALGTAEAAWHERRLGDDLPLMIGHSLGKLPEELRNDVEQELAKERGRLFDSHPTTRQRIARATAAKEPGIFHDERAASILFRDYEGLCRTISMDFYSSVLGPRLADARPTSSRALIEQSEAEDAMHEAAERFSFGLYRVYRPYPLHADLMELTEDPRQVLAALQRARTYLVCNHELTEADYDALDRIYVQRYDWLCAEALFKSEVVGSLTIHDVKMRSAADAAAVLRQVESEQEAALAGVAQVEAQLLARFARPLQLLHHPKVAERLPEAPALLREARRMVDALRALGDAMETIIHVREYNMIMRALLNQLPRKGEPAATLVSRIRTVSGQLETTMRTSLMMLNSATYPFEHGHESPTLAHFVFGDIPRKEDIGRLLGTAEDGLQRFNRVGHRAFGRLALICERVEQAVGLPALPYTPREGVNQDQGEQA